MSEVKAEGHASLAQRARVLIVDDDTEILTFLSTLLELEGIEPLVATSAKAAVRMLSEVRHAPPDLLLLDIAMPERDGLDLCRALKKDAALSGIPVFVVSARPGRDVAERALAAGAEQFIRKPFENGELIAAIRDRVRRQL